MTKLNDAKVTSLMDTDKEQLQEIIPNVQEAIEKLSQADEKLQT